MNSLRLRLYRNSSTLLCSNSNFFFLLVKFAVINYISVIKSSILNIIEQIIIIIL